MWGRGNRVVCGAAWRPLPAAPRCCLARHPTSRPPTHSCTAPCTPRRHLHTNPFQLIELPRETGLLDGCKANNWFQVGATVH